MLFDVERAIVAGRPVLRAVGELDIATSPQLAEAADAELAAGARALVVDLTGTTFMDSSGARVLVRLARRAARDEVVLHVVCPRGNRPVRLVIDLLDLQAVVPVVEISPVSPGLAQGDDGS